MRTSRAGRLRSDEANAPGATTSPAPSGTPNSEAWPSNTSRPRPSRRAGALARASARRAYFTVGRIDLFLFLGRKARLNQRIERGERGFCFLAAIFRHRIADVDEGAGFAARRPRLPGLAVAVEMIFHAVGADGLDPARVRRVVVRLQQRACPDIHQTFGARLVQRDRATRDLHVVPIGRKRLAQLRHGLGIAIRDGAGQGIIVMQTHRRGHDEDRIGAAIVPLESNGIFRPESREHRHAGDDVAGVSLLQHADDDAVVVPPRTAVAQDRILGPEVVLGTRGRREQERGGRRRRTRSTGHHRKSSSLTQERSYHLLKEMAGPSRDPAWSRYGPAFPSSCACLPRAPRRARSRSGRRSSRAPAPRCARQPTPPRTARRPSATKKPPRGRPEASCPAPAGPRRRGSWRLTETFEFHEKDPPHGDFGSAASAGVAYSVFSLNAK